MIINVDLDGVVYDFHKQFTKYISLLVNGGWLMPEPITWEFWHEWNMSHDEWKGWFRKGIEDKEIWWKGDAISGAAHNLWKLSGDGHTIRIVTYRLVHKFNHAASIQATVSWLDDNNIPYHDIAFLSHRTSKNDIRADVVLDDNPNYLPAGLESNGARGVLFERPWNRTAVRDYYSVDSWDNFYEGVNAMESV
jgi:5'(3')-deoxyribonucleotidase